MNSYLYTWILILWKTDILVDPPFIFHFFLNLRFTSSVHCPPMFIGYFEIYLFILEEINILLVKL